MEDTMTRTDANSLYVLICSLTATVMSLPAAWYFAAAAYAAPGLVARRLRAKVRDGYAD